MSELDIYRDKLKTHLEELIRYFKVDLFIEAIRDRLEPFDGEQIEEDIDNIKYYSHFICAYNCILDWMYQEQLEEYEKIGIDTNSLKVVEKKED
jgi:hypothetical protein